MSKVIFEGTMSQYATVGQRIPRVDGPAKVTGEAIYSADIYLKGMLHGKILRSPYPHAKILNIDTPFRDQISPSRWI